MAGEAKFATRLNSFRAGGRSAIEAVEMVAAVPGIGAVELNYPQHFTDAGLLVRARELGLEVTALNLRWDDPKFAHGAFTHPEPSVRQAAIALAVEAADLAAREGIGHVILWMGPDGFDYPFQANYAALWDAEIAGFRAVAEAQPGVRVSVEPKPSDPRRISLIRGASDGLLAAMEVSRPNFGVTLDLCHILMAGEHPAAAAAILLRAGRLFGLHLNDGFGQADDGMMAGSVQPGLLLELLAVVRAAGWAGTIYFDTFPEATHLDPAAECAANVETVRRMLALLERLPPSRLAEVQGRQDGLAAASLMRELTLGPADG
ncbi:MAG: TIM barrel protein [Pseudomonadota bacterium]